MEPVGGTLEYFLNSVHFGKREMGSASERVGSVSKFIDEILLYNAKAWDANMPFMSASGIGQKWTRDIGIKMPTWKTNQKTRESKPNQNQNKFQQKEKKVMPETFATDSITKFARTKLTRLASPLGIQL